MKPIVLACGLTALSACSAVGPDFLRPQVKLASSYSFAETAARQSALRDRWWTVLGDPALNALMREGLQRNLDIRTAQARIAESAALLRAEGVAASQLDGTLTVDAPRVVINERGDSLGTERATLSGAFIFDLFGQASRRRQQAAARLEASAFEAEATRLAYQADLAGAVIEARFFQAAAAATQRRIVSRRQILGLTRESFENGQLTRENVVRAQAELAQARAELPALRNGLHLSAVRVATLLDMPVGPVVARLRMTDPGQPIPARIFDAGVPADLLRNRPDVLAAERELAAAFAAIGVAEADLYPALSLNGLILLDGRESFTLGPRLSLPILGRGRLIALRDATVARAEQAELGWREAIRSAVADVERALVSIDTAQAEIAAYGEALSRFRSLVSLSRETYEIGATTLLELLDAEQELRAAELALIRARRDLALATARLAVATGRGQSVQVAPDPQAVAVVVATTRDAAPEG